MRTGTADYSSTASRLAELSYGQPASMRDPVSLAFAHGGKAGTPFRRLAGPERSLTAVS